MCVRVELFFKLMCISTYTKKQKHINIDQEKERDESRVKKEENQFQSAVPVEELEEWPIITIIIEIPTKKRYTNKTAN